MSDSTVFLNTYTDIVFENFLAVLKQNLMFQTQLKVAEASLQRVAELEAQTKELQSIREKYLQCESRLDQVTNELNVKREEISQTLHTNADHHRIQTALNEKMREIVSLQTQVTTMNETVAQYERETQSLHTQLTQAHEEIARLTSKLGDKKAMGKHKKLTSPSIPTPSSSPVLPTSELAFVSSGGNF